VAQRLRFKDERFLYYNIPCTCFSKSSQRAITTPQERDVTIDTRCALTRCSAIWRRSFGEENPEGTYCFSFSRTGSSKSPRHLRGDTVTSLGRRVSCERRGMPPDEYYPRSGDGAHVPSRARKSCRRRQQGLHVKKGRNNNVCPVGPMHCTRTYRFTRTGYHAATDTRNLQDDPAKTVVAVYNSIELLPRYLSFFAVPELCL